MEAPGTWGKTACRAGERRNGSPDERTGLRFVVKSKELRIDSRILAKTMETQVKKLRRHTSKVRERRHTAK